MSKQRKISKEAIKKLREHADNLITISYAFDFLEKKFVHEVNFECQSLLQILSEYVRKDKNNFVTYFLNHGFIE